MRNIKSQKGAISLFVVLSMLFFLAFMLGVFSITGRRNAAQLEAVRETAKIYSSGLDADTLYDSMVATKSTNVIPISTYEQLLEVKKIQETGGTANYIINNKLYTYTQNATYMLANDIVVDLNTYVHNQATVSIIDYILYNKTTYKIDLNNHDLYYQLHDGSLWKCILYHDISAGYFASTTDAQKNVSSGNKFSILGTKQIDDYKIDNKYEFLLAYNKYDDKFDLNDTDTYQRWTQSNNPNETTESVTNGTGKADNSTTEGWSGGLSKSSSGNTTWDCCSGGSWWYAVGQLAKWNGDGTSGSTKGIPAYSGQGGTKSATKCLLLIRSK